VLRLKLKRAARNFDKTRSSMNQKNTAFIALGSNKGDRIKYFRSFIMALIKNSEIKVVKSSSVYETKPFGKVKQPNYLNAVIEVRTSYKLQELFVYLKNLETELGRTKTKKWGPREIDLDVLFFNDEIFTNKKLIVPHYGIQDRDFVLIPLNQISPHTVHPVLNEKISDICNRDISRNIIRKTRLKII